MSYVLAKIAGQDPAFVQLVSCGDRWKIINEVGGYHDRDKNEVEIVTEYGDDEVQAYNAYLLETAPKPAEPCARFGFVSPEGQWYPCSYCAHCNLAEKLAALHLTNAGWSAEKSLKEAGWLIVKARVIVGAHSMRPAAAATMKDVLWRFLEAPDDTNWFSVFLANPEGYWTQNWMTSPDDFDVKAWAREELDRFEGNL